jgi:hypothetical protein
MPADTAQVTVSTATIRGRLRRGYGDVDGRTVLARRTKRRAALFVAELGGTVSPLQMLKIQRAAELVVTAELMRTASLRGERINPLELVRVENLGARAVAALDLPIHRRSALDVQPAPYDIETARDGARNGDVEAQDARESGDQAQPAAGAGNHTGDAVIGQFNTAGDESGP